MLGNKLSTTPRHVIATASSMAATTTDIHKLQAFTCDPYPHGMRRLSSAHTSMETAISRLGHVALEEFKPSRFVKPQSVAYWLDGHRRRWDVVEAHDSVAIVLYHRGLQSMLIVRQFRPALYAKALRTAVNEGLDQNLPLAHGFACELCAGIVDKNKSLTQIAREEVQEECGYNVPLADIQEITSYAASIGVQGSNQTLFFAEIDDSMKCEGGGGLQSDGECIELLALPIRNVEAFIMDDSIPKTSGAMFGLLWCKNLVMSS